MLATWRSSRTRTRSQHPPSGIHSGQSILFWWCMWKDYVSGIFPENSVNATSTRNIVVYSNTPYAFIPQPPTMSSSGYIPPLEVVLAFVGGGVTDGGEQDDSVVLTTDEFYTPLRIAGSTLESITKELQRRAPTRIDFKSSERRPFIVDFEYTGVERMTGCTCKDGSCDTCFAFVDRVSSAFADEITILFGRDPVRFYSGGRGFHLYAITPTAWTQHAVDATIAFLTRRVSRRLQDPRIRYAVDAGASSPTHNMRLPLSARANGNIVCLAPRGFSRVDAPTVDTITPEHVKVATDAMKRALYYRHA